MSARNRGRNASSQDTDEERRLWKEIRERASEAEAMTASFHALLLARSEEIGYEIIAIEADQAKFVEEHDGLSSADLDDRLEKLYRENVKICEEVQQIMAGESNGMNLLDSLNVLAGLRGASEESAQSHSQPSQRAASGKLARPKKGSASKHGSATPAVASTETGDHSHEPSAAPSPRIHLSTNRLNGKEGKSSRAASVAGTREASVKVEQDGAESVASSTDAPSTVTGPIANGKTTAAAASGGNRATNRLVLRLGEIVFCRHDWKNVKPGADPLEGEGILCKVTNVIGEGKQRRYEVQDADPSGEPPPPQRASVSQLIQIPESNKGLPDLAKGRSVLAQYPDTTTFYKAEVFEPWKGVKLTADAEPALVKLNFQDDEQSREVERKFVLTEK